LAVYGKDMPMSMIAAKLEDLEKLSTGMESP